MACDCAGQSYSTLPSAVNQCTPPACPLLYHHRDRAALAILVLLPTHPLFLLNSTFFSVQAPFFLIPFAEGRIRCGGFPALNLLSENRLSAFSHAVVFSREADF